MNIEARNFVPIYYQFANRLKDKICLGEFPPSSRLPNEEDLSRIYGISRVTIRNSLKKLEAEGFIQRIKGRGTFVSPAAKKTRNIILILHWPYGADANVEQGLLSGAVVEAEGIGAQIHFATSESFRAALEKALHTPTLHPGVLFLRHFKDEDVDFIEKHGVPYLIEGEKTDRKRNWIDIDNRDAMRQVCDHLHELGHRSFGIFTGAGQGLHYNERVAATLERLSGLNVPPKQIHTVEIPDGDMERLSYEMASEFFKSQKHPSAIICVGDYLAAGLSHWLENNNYKVPEDVAVTGFDDNIICRYQRPPLTSVRQDFFELGRLAVRHLSHMMDDYVNSHVKVKIKLKLVIRGSTLPDKRMTARK